MNDTLNHVKDYLAREAENAAKIPIDKQRILAVIDATVFVNHRLSPPERLLCSYCNTRLVEVTGVGGPKCSACEDMLFEG